jgi:hypothetical protein
MVFLAAIAFISGMSTNISLIVYEILEKAHFGQNVQHYR